MKHLGFEKIRLSKHSKGYPMYSSKNNNLNAPMSILVQGIAAILYVLAINLRSHGRVISLCVISLITGLISFAQEPTFYDKQYQNGDTIRGRGLFTGLI